MQHQQHRHVSEAPEAFRRARASSERPSRTKASSMTGSSRKDVSNATPGAMGEASPATNDVMAPNPIREFMLGLPLQP